MALPVNGSTHLISAYYSFYRPRKDERLSWPSWLTYSGWLTHISGHPSAAGRAQDRESSPAIETDVLPLCHATTSWLKILTFLTCIYFIVAYHEGFIQHLYITHIRQYMMPFWFYHRNLFNNTLYCLLYQFYILLHTVMPTLHRPTRPVGSDAVKKA